MAQSQIIILKKDKSIDYHKEADSFLNILNKAKNEHDVQKYIKNNKKWFIPGSLFHEFDFGHHEAMIIPEFRLGAEYVADYLLLGRNSTGRQIVLVEFEDVNVDFCQKSKNEITVAVRNGITQIHDWKRWMEYNKQYMIQNTELSEYLPVLPGWAIRYCLVVSRRSRMTEMANNLRGEIRLNELISVVTYDRLVDDIRCLVNGF